MDLNNTVFSELIDGYRIRVTNKVDDENINFENKLRARQADHAIALNLTQTCTWLQQYLKPYVLLQFTDVSGYAAAQIAVYLHTPRRAQWYSHAVAQVPGSSFARTEDANFALRILPRLLLRTTSACKLRLQAYGLLPQELHNIEAACTHAGYFAATENYSYIKTVVYDLRPTLDALLAGFSKKTRAKLKHYSRDLLNICVLSDKKWIPSMRQALAASFSRTGEISDPFDFETHFNVAAVHPERVLILGIFLQSNPDNLLAYSITIRHDDCVEAISSGSVADPELRKTHFNYFMYWEMIQWARNGFSKILDLGGITDGGEADPLAGISAFKRHFAQEERVVSREYIFIIKKNREFIFNNLTNLKAHFSRRFT